MEDMRYINTNLKGQKAYELISSVIGQMSDGYYEDNPAMQRYWDFTYPYIDDEENVYILVSNKKNHYDKFLNRTANNAFLDKTDKQVKEFFANKIKFFIKEEKLTWDRNNDKQTTLWMCYEEDITVKDAYKVYDTLKERTLRQ